MTQRVVDLSAHEFPLLKRLILHNVFLARGISGLAALAHIELWGFATLQWFAWTTLIESCPKLRSIMVRRVDDTSEFEISPFCTRISLPQLERVDIRFLCRWTVANLLASIHAPRLRELVLADIEFRDDHGEFPIADLLSRDVDSELVYYHPELSRALPREFLRTLITAENLESLVITASSMTLRAMLNVLQPSSSQIIPASKLKKLSVGYQFRIQEDPVLVAQMLLTVLDDRFAGGCDRLESLTLDSCIIEGVKEQCGLPAKTDVSLEALSIWKRLASEVSAETCRCSDHVHTIPEGTAGNLTIHSPTNYSYTAGPEKRHRALQAESPEHASLHEAHILRE
ncbi:hypothetical protein DL93DRAFT_2088593, partial [Clavulina sp. PMI_390]